MAISVAAGTGLFGNKSDLPEIKSGLLQSVKPYIAVAAVLATGGVLVAAIYFTLLDLAWIAFLGGVLVASILAMTTQAARAEMSANNRAGQLTLANHQLAKETEYREKLEVLLHAADARLQYADESLPVMLAFVDQYSRYQYHNRAFGTWIGLQDEKIDGQHMRDVLGRKVFAEVEPYVYEVAAGRIVRYERTHKSSGGSLYRLAVQYLPQFAADGKYCGFYKTITDITERRDVSSPPGGRTANDPAQPPHGGAAFFGAAGTLSGDAMATDESAASTEEAWQDASRHILAAISGNEFALFCQHITPLAGGDSEHYEVLIRLLEEESSMVPPGAFFALAEEHGLLPQLDRWVFTHVLEWILTKTKAGSVLAGSIYFINIATSTISDPDFPEFVEAELRRTGVPATSLCLEIDEEDVNLHQGDCVAFARAMRQCGCLIAISGFGRNRVPIETLKLFPVDFLKIDGSIVRQILAHPSFLGKTAAISRMAKAIGVRTIAEMVEDEGTLALLREAKVDFAQGFGISLPQPLSNLTTPDHIVRAPPGSGMTDPSVTRLTPETLRGDAQQLRTA